MTGTGNAERLADNVCFDMLIGTSALCLLTLLTLPSLKTTKSHLFVHVLDMCVHATAPVWRSEDTVWECPLFSHCTGLSWGLNSVSQIWQQPPLPVEPSHCLVSAIFRVDMLLSQGLDWFIVSFS